MDDWFVYVLACGDGSLYTGVARDVDARLEQHRAGKGAKYTRGRGPLELVYQERVPDQSSALKRELAIKRLSRADKEALTQKKKKKSKTKKGGSSERRAATHDVGSRRRLSSKAQR